VRRAKGTARRLTPLSPIKVGVHLSRPLQVLGHQHPSYPRCRASHRFVALVLLGRGHGDFKFGCVLFCDVF
jgi:hypothetical protein